MTHALPELGDLPQGLVLDGEIVAWMGSVRWFPHVGRRVLNGDLTVPVTFIIFDLLRIDGTDMTSKPYSERRLALEQLDLVGQSWRTGEAFDDGPALFAAVCELGLEGVVAKRLSSRYRSGARGWVKAKNPAYWRRDSEREAVARSRERRARLFV
jgi:bifunctional non-homologous end joining protein LigD